MEKEIIGEGSIQSLEGILKHYSAQRVFLATGKKSYELSGAKEKIEKLLKRRDYHRHFDFEENPKFPDLLQGARDIRAYKPDIIVAIGGGSVMDTAKILSVLPTDTSKAKKVIKGEIDFDEKISPIVAIPTTSGSGSEATHFAVAYLNNVKYSVAGKSLLPDYVILDPDLTYSMSPYQTAVSGMDALCQGIESYWAKGATKESREYAADAIKVILNNIENAVNNPNSESLFNMAKGANLAGKAINISKTTAPHALSYSLSTFYGIPHGHAVALTIKEFILINEVKASQNNDLKLTRRMEQLYKLIGGTSGMNCGLIIQQVMNRIGLESSLNEITFGKENININKLVNNINVERLGNHPVLVSIEDVNDVYLNIL
jgi:alcohol dehydrogenase class IV